MSGDCNECKHRVYLQNKSGKLIASCDTLKCRFEKTKGDEQDERMDVKRNCGNRKEL